MFSVRSVITQFLTSLKFVKLVSLFSRSFASSILLLLITGNLRKYMTQVTYSDIRLKSFVKTGQLFQQFKRGVQALKPPFFSFLGREWAKNRSRGYGLDSFGSEYRSVVGYCEYVDEHVFHKVRGIPEQLNDYWFLHAALP
jgi:hypothetical protein